MRTLTGYVLGAQMPGYPTSHTTVVFWGGAALLAGPSLGLGAHWVRIRRDLMAAIGAGVVCGVLVGERLYGLARIADTTYPPYWWGEILVGLALLLAVVWRRLLGFRAFIVSVGLTVLVALAFVVVYSRARFGRSGQDDRSVMSRVPASTYHVPSPSAPLKPTIGPNFSRWPRA